MISALVALAMMKPAMPQVELADASELPARFNLARGDTRLLMILSPTSRTSLAGAHIVKRDVLDHLVGESVRTFIVWTPMARNDTWDAAQKVSGTLDSLDVEQFWDPSHSLARQYGKILKLPVDRELAWNVYLVNSRTEEWKSRPPTPVAWMHQLGSDDRTLDGPTLLDLMTKETKKPLPANWRAGG